MKSCSEYRAAARETLRGHWSEWAVAYLVIMVIAVVLSVPFSLLGQVSMALEMFGSGMSTVVNILLVAPLGYAFSFYMMSYKRGESSVSSPLQGVWQAFREHYEVLVIGGLLAMVVTVCVGIVTLFIGAVIFSLAYSLFAYVVKDYPELSGKEALRKSRMMMKGHKWELFVLNLSFIGWVLLCIVTLGILTFWVVPYISAAVAHFYEDVKTEYESRTDI